MAKSIKFWAFPAAAVILAVVFYIWTPFPPPSAPDAYADQEGQLLLPQRNVAIVTLELLNAGLKFTKAADILKLRPVQEDFMALPGVSKVDSILSVSRVISREDEIIVERAIPQAEDDLSDAWMVQLAAELPEFPELSPYIDPEQNTLLFYIEYSNRTSPQSVYKGLTALQNKWKNTIPFEFTGRSAVIAATETLLARDIALFFPLLIVMVVIIFSLLRSLKIVLTSLTLITVSIAMAYGFVHFLGIPDSPLLVLIPVFCLGLLSDYAIHYFYHRQYAPSGGRSLNKILMFPLSLTALSTLTGFLSLTLINGSGHLQLGLLIAFSVVVTWIGVFYWCAFGQFAPAKKPIFSGFRQWQGKLFARMARYRYAAFLAVGAAAIWGFLALNNLSIEPYPIQQLPASITIKKADAIINKAFYGSVPYFIEVDTGVKNGMLNKDAMLALDRIHRQINNNKTGFSYSILTVLKRMNYYFMEDEESFLTSTEFDDRYDALIEQYLVYYSSGVDPTEYESMVNSSYRVFSIKGYLYYTDYRQMENFLELIDRIDSTLPENWSLNIHGMARQLEQEQTALRRNWIFSFLSGSLLIFVTVLIFYRKLSLALISLVPGIISMLISFGFIRLAGISIDVFSIIFVAIITGLVIDYSIHTLAALNLIKQVENLEEGFSSIIGFSGIPLYLSFLTSLLSFSILFLSSFRGARTLGFLLLISLGISFILSLYLIPLVILPRRLKKGD